MDDPVGRVSRPGEPAKIAAGKTSLPRDSMVTVRLSEPPVVDYGGAEIKGPADEDVSQDVLVERDAREEDSDDTDADTVYEKGGAARGEGGRGSDSSADSINWEVLERTEEQEPRNQDTEDSTALLLARLERENNLIVSNPKSGLTRVTDSEPSRSRPRPPSMQQLKQMVQGPAPPSLRYSLLPAPPMTDLEFYAALVQDYKRTAQRLPTLLSKKIRAGIPPPLRGVVWQSMSGARDLVLEEEYDRLCGESSPYEGIIGKDLGRSFPGVEMFRDPDGDGQRMLGKVLKCFSLYDNKIGYCQGLGFLVGPLLMHMGDRQAFCVLVRLMEHYDLRACYLPDLSGLHVRIYQFRELLKKHLPTLSAHLEHLQIEPAYVSQWFLSFFAVTCPLPMLFRIYDVIFAEGASETIMRVALSVMRKNEEKILGCREFEDVMQLLLSRGLWDCYHMDADKFVSDFVSLTPIVTHEVLQELEQSCKESQESGKAPVQSENIITAGSRFLGRMWNSTSKTTTLSPAGLVPHRRPGSFLRRSTSKQSMASTLNSVEGSTDSMMSTTTDATTASRKSTNSDDNSVRVPSSVFATPLAKPKTLAHSQKNLHGQIEDLLMALNEMQRDQAILMTQLQREREEREEDGLAVRSLIDLLRKKRSEETIMGGGSQRSLETVTPFVVEDPVAEAGGEGQNEETKDLSRHDTPMEHDLEKVLDENGIVPDTKTGGGPGPHQETIHVPEKSEIESEGDDQDDQLLKGTLPDVSHGLTSVHEHTGDYLFDDATFTDLLETVERRFSKSRQRESAIIQSKSQLRDDLAHSKDQLTLEISKSQELTRQLHDAEQEMSHLRDQIKEGHLHIRNGLHEKNRLERLIQDLKSKTPPPPQSQSENDDGAEWQRRSSVHSGGLRELRLGRQNSTTRGQAPQFAKRTSSLQSSVMAGEAAAMAMAAPATPTAGEAEALILELVQAKTAEAVAKQEAEEARAKLEGLRKMLGLGHSRSESQLGVGQVVVVERLSGQPAAAAAATTGGGGFWAWGKRSPSVAGLATEGR